MIKIDHFFRSEKPKFIYVDIVTFVYSEIWLFYTNHKVRDVDSVGMWHIKYKTKLDN